MRQLLSTLHSHPSLTNPNTEKTGEGVAFQRLTMCSPLSGVRKGRQREKAELAPFSLETLPAPSPGIDGGGGTLPQIWGWLLQLALTEFFNIKKWLRKFWNLSRVSLRGLYPAGVGESHGPVGEHEGREVKPFPVCPCGDETSVNQLHAFKDLIYLGLKSNQYAFVLWCTEFRNCWRVARFFFCKSKIWNVKIKEKEAH